jgi:hypothetical protein
MNGDRKYRQRGYQDSSGNGDGHSPDPKERFQPPRHAMDITAPRTPRVVQSVSAARCYACAAILAADFDFQQPCPKCGVELRCCKQCQHFESSARFQCVKPIAERVAYKEKRTDCSLFVARITVARDSAPAQQSTPKPASRLDAALAAPRPEPTISRSSHDARAAFENLFKK